MRCRTTFSFIGALALMLSGGVVRAQSYSAYDSWAKLKPGSSVTLKVTREASGRKSEMEMTYVLDEVTPDKVVVDVKSSMVVAGNRMDQPARKQEISKGAAAPASNPSSPGVDVKQSEETITIGDKSYKCRVIESSLDSNGRKATSKSWTCAEVPNLLVKMESATMGKVESKTTMEVTKIDLK